MTVTLTGPRRAFSTADELENLGSGSATAVFQYLWNLPSPVEDYRAHFGAFQSRTSTLEREWGVAHPVPLRPVTAADQQPWIDRFGDYYDPTVNRWREAMAAAYASYNTEDREGSFASENFGGLDLEWELSKTASAMVFTLIEEA